MDSQKNMKKLWDLLNKMKDIEIAAKYSTLYSQMKDIRKQKLILFYKELKKIIEKEAAERNRINISSKVNSDWKDK